MISDPVVVRHLLKVYILRDDEYASGHQSDVTGLAVQLQEPNSTLDVK